MSPENAFQMLEEYKSSLGRCEYLRALIIKLKKDEQYLINHAAELIAEQGGGSMDGMPHGTTVGNPTERKGMQLLGNAETDELKELRKEIARAEDELRRKEFITTFVDAWMKGLQEKEAWVIQKTIFQRMSYRETGNEYNKIYGEFASDDKLRRIKKAALRKIYEYAK